MSTFVNTKHSININHVYPRKIYFILNKGGGSSKYDNLSAVVDPYIWRRTMSERNNCEAWNWKLYGVNVHTLVSGRFMKMIMSEKVLAKQDQWTVWRQFGRQIRATRSQLRQHTGVFGRCQISPTGEYNGKFPSIKLLSQPGYMGHRALYTLICGQH